jgi:hypothetical protein
MNKKYISIALTLYLFNPTEIEAVKINAAQPIGGKSTGGNMKNLQRQNSSFSIVDSESLQRQNSSFSILDSKSKSLLPIKGPFSQNSFRGSVQNSKWSHSSGQPSKINLVKQFMDSDSVESKPIDPSPEKQSLYKSNYSSKESFVPRNLLPFFQLDTVSSQLIQYQDNETQTDQPAERTETGVQVATTTGTQSYPSHTSTTGAQSQPETQDKATQDDVAPPAHTENHPILTDSNLDSKSNTPSKIIEYSHSNAGLMVNNPLKSQQMELTDKNSVTKTDDHPIQESETKNIPLLSQKEDEKIEARFAKAGNSEGNPPIPTITNTTNTPGTTHHYYSTTNHYHSTENNTVKSQEVSSTNTEKSENIGIKNLSTILDIKSFIANISRSITTSFSKDLSKMFSKLIYNFNEMIARIQKNTIKKISKAEEKPNESTFSKKKPLSVYAMADNIKEKCASLRKSLIDFLQSTGNKKSAFRIQESPSKYPNVRTSYRNLGEDFEKPKRSKSARLFSLSGQRARKAIAQTLSSVRRVALDTKKIAYHYMDQDKKFSRHMKKADQYTEASFKRSRIRTDAFSRG